MAKIKSLVGKRFGRLLVISFDEKNIKKGHLYTCLCDCGNEKKTCGDNLNHGYTRSCGCLAIENNRNKLLKEKGEAARNAVWNSYRGSAQRKGIEFSLAKEDFIKITQQNCYYCGIEPSQVKESLYNNGDYIYNGIDRLDNKLGYNLDNAVSCCSICNHAKCTLSEQDFLNWIKRVYEYRHLEK